MLTLTPVEPLTEGVRYTLSIGERRARQRRHATGAQPFLLGFRAVRSGLAASTLVPADGVGGDLRSRTPIAVVFDRALDPDTLDDGMFTIQPDVAGSLEVVEAPGAAGMARARPAGAALPAVGPAAGEHDLPGHAGDRA